MVKNKKNINKDFPKNALSILLFFGLVLVIYLTNDAFLAKGALCGDSSDIEKCIEENKKKAQDYQEIIDIKKKAIVSTENQLAVIDGQQAITQAELLETENKAAQLAKQVGDLTKKITAEEKKIEFQKSILAGLMQSYYFDYQQGLLNVVLVNESFSDALKQSDNIEHSSLRLSDVLAVVKESRLKLIDQKKELEDKKIEQEKTKEDLEIKNLKLQYSEDQKQALLGRTQAEKNKYEELLSHIEDEIYNLEATKFVNYNNIPAAKGGYFDYPISVPVITQSYGCLKTAFARSSYPVCDSGKGGFHNGFDFGKNSGLNIYAVKAGKVIGSGDNGRYAYGKWIAIDHGDGLVTLYGHFNSKSVDKGATVKTGQQIGIMGTTGYSTGVHLHFSVFDKNSFEVVESSKVSGLMLPAGASITPKRYLK